MKGAPETAPYVMHTLNAVKLWIHPNGRFDLQDMGLPKEGNVSIDGDKAILTVTKIAGKDIQFQSSQTKESNAPIQLVGKTADTVIYTDPSAIDPTPIQLKRIATSGPDRP